MGYEAIQFAQSVSSLFDPETALPPLLLEKVSPGL